MLEFQDNVFALKKKLGQELYNVFQENNCTNYYIVNPVKLSYFEKLDCRSCLSMTLCHRHTEDPSIVDPEGDYYAVFVEKYDETMDGRYNSSVVDFQVESLMTLLQHFQKWLPTYNQKIELFGKLMEKGGTLNLNQEYDLLGYKFQLKKMETVGKPTAMGDMTLTVSTNRFGEKKINLWNIRHQELLDVLLKAAE